jgi:hypothetical protein
MKHTLLSSENTTAGFALVVALGLMSFILLLLLGITTFVRVESKSANQSLRILEARQNALLGMQIALGRLQLTAGPDQRVTARADLLSGTAPERRRLTGVWDTSTGDFLEWLISDFNPQSDNRGFVQSAARNPHDTDSVVLLGPGSLESVGGALVNPEDLIVVGIDGTHIRRNNQDVGRYAWWIEDEGVKARVNLDAVLMGEGKQAAVLALNNFHRAEIRFLPDFSNLSLGLDEVSRLSTMRDLPFVGIDEGLAKRYFFDFTGYSAGVLSDVRDGGLKRDLSLAFELPDPDFNNSAFADAGPSSVSGPGISFKVQPIFYCPNGGRGPTWHLLRDYYRIYQRVENPMTNPVFDAQAMRPNKDELGVNNRQQGAVASLWWETLAALRYQGDTAINAGESGDSLRSTASPGIDALRAIPIPIRANYTPYVQRNLVTFGLRFFQIPPPDPRPSGDPGNWEYRRSELLVNPGFVVHNPYNIRVRSQGLFSLTDHVRFNVRTESLLSGEVRSFQTGGNWHVLKAGPTIFEPGELRIYEGLIQSDSSNLSAVGPPLNYWIPEQATLNAPAIPVDPNDPSAPNVVIDFLPFNNARWAYWLKNSIAEGLSPVTTSINFANFAGRTYNYGGVRGQFIWREYEDWYLTNQTTLNLNTELFRRESNDAPVDFFNFDLFLKPADHLHRFATFSHNNPLAPNITSRNLFTSTATQRTGYPVLDPGWQVEIYTTNFPGMDVLQSSGNNAFWGLSNQGGGRTHVAAIELPTTPAISLGKLQNANLGIFGHMPALAVGNSFASPFLSRDAVSGRFNNLISTSPALLGGNERVFYDLSYLANEALWDGYFFSSYSLAYNRDTDSYLLAPGPRESFDAAFDNNYSRAGVRSGSLPNPRMQLHAPRESLAAVRDKLFTANGTARPEGVNRAAENLLVAGSFNIHSTSVDAWRSVLSAARNTAIYRSGEVATVNYGSNRTPFPHLTQPAHGAYNGNLSSPEAWGGFTALTDAQIESLAEAIVDELRLRVDARGGPFLSLADFVNRELQSNNLGLAGLLQAAIDKSTVNQGFSGSATAINLAGGSGNFPFANNISDGSGGARSSASGAAAKILQGNILQAIGSFIAPRSDTFRIRAYGDVINPLTNTVTSRIWAEAVYQRIAEPVYPAAVAPADSQFWVPQEMERFGRRFQLVSFRWLNEDDV